ncbi:MAG TPA: ABC transporter permease, partial [Elusimicrobiales bacterium]|nr:ABC transporter permease [Elusimicrobiales bacterium]
MKAAASIIFVLGLWQAAGAFGWLNPYLLPPPTEVLKAFREVSAGGALFFHIAASLKRVLTGLALASFTAIPLGVVVGARPGIRAYFLPLLEILRPIPPIAWIPLAILWFGIRGDAASNFITFIAAFFPLFLHTFSGMQHIEQIHIDAAKTLGADRRMLVLDVALPSALPYIITGFRIS